MGGNCESSGGTWCDPSLAQTHVHQEGRKVHPHRSLRTRGSSMLAEGAEMDEMDMYDEPLVEIDGVLLHVFSYVLEVACRPYAILSMKINSAWRVTLDRVASVIRFYLAQLLLDHGPQHQNDAVNSRLVCGCHVNELINRF